MTEREARLEEALRDFASWADAIVEKRNVEDWPSLTRFAAQLMRQMARSALEAKP